MKRHSSERTYIADDDMKLSSRHKAKSSESSNSESSTDYDEADDDMSELGQIPIRPRQRFTTEETNILEKTYEKYERPASDIKQTLAADFNTSVSRIQIWFQNRRAKAKKTLSSPKKESTTIINPPQINTVAHNGATYSQKQKSRHPHSRHTPYLVSKDLDGSEAKNKDKRKKARDNSDPFSPPLNGDYPAAPSIPIGNTQNEYGVNYQPAPLISTEVLENPRSFYSTSDYQNEDILKNFYDASFDPKPFPYPNLYNSQTIPSGTLYQPFSSPYPEELSIDQSIRHGEVTNGSSSFIDPQKTTHFNQTPYPADDSVALENPKEDPQTNKRSDTNAFQNVKEVISSQNKRVKFS